MTNVVDDDLPSRLQHPRDFQEGFGAVGRGVEVVDRAARDDPVERPVRERDPPHVRGPDLDAVGDALEPRVLERRLGPVAGQVLRLPDIDAERLATPRETLGGADEEQPAAAADVEHRFVSPPLHAVEELLALLQFPEAARPEHVRAHAEASDRHAESPRANPESPDDARPEACLDARPEQKTGTSGEEEVA